MNKTVIKIKYLIVILLLIFNSSLAESLNYKDLEKLSKNNTFMDNNWKSEKKYREVFHKNNN